MRFFKAALLSTAALWAAQLAALQPARSDSRPTRPPTTLIPRKLLFGDPERFGPVISPDGKYFAFRAHNNRKILNIWISKVGDRTDRMITDARRGYLDGPYWQADSRHILFSQDFDGDENWHIYQTDIETKSTRDLTPIQGCRATRLAMEPRYPDWLLVTLNMRDKRYDDVYKINLKTGALEQIAENPGDVSGWVADHRLRIRGATAVTKSGITEIRVRDDEKSPWRTVISWGPEDEGNIVEFSPDNKLLYMLTSLGSNTKRLVALNLANSKITTLARNASYDMSEVQTNPRTHQLEAVGVVTDHLTWQALRPNIKDELIKLEKLGANFSILTRDIKNQKWVVEASADTTSPVYYLYDRAKGKVKLLYRQKPDYANYKLAKMQTVTITSRDGMKLQCYLTLPPDREPKNLPAVVHVHGGPWSRASWGFDNMAQWLANRGYAYLSVNFRGSTGFGKKFVNAGDRQWGKKMNDDVVDAKHWLVEKGYADPKRISITGSSYGGYETLAAAAFTPDQFSCGIDHAGPANLATLLKSIPSYWEAGKILLYKRIGDPQKDAKYLESISPVFKAQNIKIPMLVAQGENDVRVKKSEADQIVAAMRKNGVEVEYLLFPKCGHGFANEDDDMKFRAESEKFLARHLGGRYEPAGKNENIDHLKH